MALMAFSRAPPPRRGQQNLDAALADYDDEFTSLQLETGQLDPVSSGAVAAAVGGVAAAAAAAAPAPLDHF